MANTKNSRSGDVLIKSRRRNLPFNHDQTRITENYLTCIKKNLARHLKNNNIILEKRIMNGLFEHVNFDASLPDLVKAHIEISGSKILFKDSRPGCSLIHGQLIIPQSSLFNTFSIAGDHGCGASLFECPKKFNENVAKKTLPHLATGGNTVSHTQLKKQITYQTSKFISSLDPEIRPIITHCHEGRLGSLGSGNHFVHFVRKDNRPHLVVHTGSRGLYSTICKKRLIDPTFTPKTEKILVACEKYAELNRRLIANFVLKGDYKNQYTPYINETHTKLDRTFGIPLIQKNITKNYLRPNHMILGNEESGVALLNTQKQPYLSPYIVHGSGPLWGHKGKFQTINNIKNATILNSILNYSQHRSKGGKTQP